MPKKIIFAVSNDLSYDQRMERICNSLVINGYDIVLLGREKSNSIRLDQKKFRQVRMKCGFEKGKLFYLEYNFRLLFYLLFHRFDIVGSVDMDTLTPCFLAAKLKQKACVFDAHEYFDEVPEVVNRPLVKWFWKMLGRLLIPRLKHAYTVSESLQEIFTKKYNVPFALIRNITDGQIYDARLEKEKKEKIILYQGVLNEGRGLEQMIRAMRHIQDAQLWLAGEGDLSQTLRDLVKKLDLEHRVKFLGYLKPDSLRKITLKATIGLNLLENRGLSYYYSLANKTFDYIHAELPAIHPDFPEYQKIMEKAEVGILVKDLEINTLAAVVNRLLLEMTFYEQLKINCQKAKAIFNWEKEEKRLIEFYQKIV